MIISICALIIIARIKHYRLKYLFYSWSFYPILIMQCIMIFLPVSIFCGSYYFLSFNAFIQPAIILCFIFSILDYRLYKPAIIGSLFIFFGTFLNRFVIAQNGGKMPVFPSLSYLTGFVSPQSFEMDKLHMLGSEATRFKFLSDYIDLGYRILSPGDIFIHLFAFIMLYSTLKAANIRYNKLNNINRSEDDLIARNFN